MVPASEFERRRTALVKAMDDDGIVLLLGHDQAPMNYPGNPYPFRQESSFRYFFGLDEPGAAGWLDLATGDQRLYAHVPDLDSVIWEGDLPSLGERAEPYGAVDTRPVADLAGDVTAVTTGRRIHTLPPTRADGRERLTRLVGGVDASPDLVGAVVALRERKSPAEIDEITEALDRTATLHRLAMAETRPGLTEHDVVRRLKAVAAAAGWEWAYPIIFSVRGEVLHNLGHDNPMASGQLVVNDSGVTSPGGYASDVTRTFPVSGRFSTDQLAVYDIVRAAQAAALARAGAGIPYRAVHEAAGRVITEGLSDLGIMRGDPEESVAAGAFTAFMPHGVGHMLGLDVHDMEGLGEDNVGYDRQHRRAEAFGLSNLRLAKPLRPGFVVTVEPGIYFIPKLLRRWAEQGVHEEFIDFTSALRFERFGGVRIEDVISVTTDGVELLGDPIPTSPADVEAACTA